MIGVFQSILTAPRVYFAMADDGLFFRKVAWLAPSTRVPVIAIVLQSVWTIAIALSGRYEQILNYVIAMDFLFFGLTATTIFVFRWRVARGAMTASAGYQYIDANSTFGGTATQIVRSEVRLTQWDSITWPQVNAPI